ncbi:hypothetical protein F5B17DRAFT_440880 [Nemania serpens]|nr:hypothetical protein F5B17DRAFT_440880 [Nemania serpens]
MPRKYRRTGNNTCRQRKLKCDETVPICRRCSKAQRYCDRSGRPASTTEHPISRDLNIADDDPRKALESLQLTNYFRRYITNVAPWYDLGDSHCCFSAEVPIIALDEPLLFHAIIALAAMYSSQTTTPSARTIAEAYHTRCIRRLIELDPEDLLIKQGVALAVTCLLRSYEILAESRDPNRHLKGAFSLASQFQNLPDRSSGGLLHSGFWNYLREDITFSLFRNCALKINLDSVPGLDNVSSDQDHLNSISLVLGRIINAMIGSTSEMVGNTWELMWSYVKDWLSTLPAHFEPFSRAALPSLSRLPTVHMLKSCQAASRHYLLVSVAVLAIHAQNILEVNDLMTFASRMGFLLGTFETKENLLEHIGLEICGIAFTSNEPSVLVNAFGPISYCAKYIRTEASRQEVVGQLMASRKTTGWPVQQLVSDLRRHWATDLSAS